MTVERVPRVGMSWMQVGGSALAAVSSAVLLSTLGVAGTVIGAGLGSVVATVGTALYTRTLDASRQHVAVQTAALRRVARARSELDEAEEVLGADSDAGPGAVPGAAPRALPWRLSWQRLAVVAAGVFLCAMVAITAFELAAGRAVSELTGGTDTPTSSTVPGLGRGGDRGTGPAQEHTPDDDTDDPEPDASAAPSETPTEDPTGSSGPTSDPTVSDEPSSTVLPTPSPTASTAPSPSPTTGSAP